MYPPEVYKSYLTPFRFLQRSAAVFREKVAIIHRDLCITYPELNARVNRLASALRNAGIAREDRVAVLLPNIPQMLEAHFGVPLSGGIMVAINTRLKTDEIAYILDHSGAKALIVDSELAPLVEPALPGLPALETVMTVHDVDASALILEVTETAAVADVALARAFAERMTALGCRFALDDFGAGFGSFYYLKHLLFDYVKIDGEFVAHAHQSQVDRTIMRSIVGIARDLGKRTVAEFVSEPEILEIVRAEGVDHAQGFLVGRPLPFDEFVDTFIPVRPLTLPGGR